MIPNQSILIVDDEPELREIIAFDFENAGFTVTCAENGKMALDLMSSQEFSAIVSDIRMPVMDGPELLKRVREKNTSIVFIFISAYSDLTIENALNNGVDGIMVKPFDRRGLVSRVQKLLLPTSQRWSEEVKDLKDAPAVSLSFSSLVEAKSQSKILIGRGGIFIAENGRLPQIGSYVTLKIQFELEKKNLEGVGIVRWIRPDAINNKPVGMGVEFLKLDIQSSEFVIKEIESTHTKSFIPA